MSDYLVGHIRTLVPIIVGAVVAWLATVGLELDADSQAGLIVGLTGVLQAVYYAAVRFLAERWGWVGALLGVNRAPTYLNH